MPGKRPGAEETVSKPHQVDALKSRESPCSGHLIDRGCGSSMFPVTQRMQLLPWCAESAAIGGGRAQFAEPI